MDRLNIIDRLDSSSYNYDNRLFWHQCSCSLAILGAIQNIACSRYAVDPLVLLVS